MSTIADYPPAAALDGSEVVPLWQNGQQVAAPASKLPNAATTAQLAILDRAQQARAGAEAALAGAIAASPLTGVVENPVYAAAIQSRSGAVAIGIEANGEVRMGTVKARRLGNLPVTGFSHRQAAMPAYRPSLHYISYMGQSEQNSSVGGGRFNTTQRYGMMAMPYHSVGVVSAAANSSASSGSSIITVPANSTVAVDMLVSGAGIQTGTTVLSVVTTTPGGGSPVTTITLSKPLTDAEPSGTSFMFTPQLYPLLGTTKAVNGSPYGYTVQVQKEGAMHGITYAGELAEGRDGVLLDQARVMMLVGSNATGSTSMAQNAAGGPTGNWENTLAQARFAKTLATSMGLPFVFEAVSWRQGPGGTGGPEGATYGYKGALRKFAADMDVAGRAITGSANPVNLLVTQINSPTGGGDPIANEDFPVARAQLDAYLDGGSRVVLTTPEYITVYGDPLHSLSRGSLIQGSYDALAYSRLSIERVGWTPLTFTVDAVIGNTIILKAIGAEGPLVIDTKTLPAQNDVVQGMLAGFTFRTTDGKVVPVSRVDAGVGYVCITLAVAPSTGTLRYALNRCVNRDPATGGCGNLRDSLGDLLPIYDGNGVWWRMHKWAFAQQWSIGA